MNLKLNSVYSLLWSDLCTVSRIIKHLRVRCEHWCRKNILDSFGSAQSSAQMLKILRSRVEPGRFVPLLCTNELIKNIGYCWGKTFLIGYNFWPKSSQSQFVLQILLKRQPWFLQIACFLKFKAAKNVSLGTILLKMSRAGIVNNNHNNKNKNI